jgi:hypothetical protein
MPRAVIVGVPKYVYLENTKLAGKCLKYVDD